MDVNAPATTTHAGRRFHFCSDHCREAFDQSPRRYAPSDSPVDTTAR